MESKRIVVSGRVQGVGYRYFVVKIANELQLAGFVRNLPNGKVEIEVEGEGSAIATLIDYCQIGPARAAVTSINTQSQPLVGYTSFGIK